MPKIKTVHGMEDRKVVSQNEWLAAKGRDENPESTQDWVRYHDKYRKSLSSVPWERAASRARGGTAKVLLTKSRELRRA